MIRHVAGALALVLAPASLAQTTWYVDVNGNPPGSGTQNDPYTSIQFAIDQATTLAGDRLQVAPGNYREALDLAGKELMIIATEGPQTEHASSRPTRSAP